MNKGSSKEIKRTQTTKHSIGKARASNIGTSEDDIENPQRDKRDKSGVVDMERPYVLADSPEIDSGWIASSKHIIVHSTLTVPTRSLLSGQIPDEIKSQIIPVHRLASEDVSGVEFGAVIVLNPSYIHHSAVIHSNTNQKSQDSTIRYLQSLSNDERGRMFIHTPKIEIVDYFIMPIGMLMGSKV